LILLFGWAFFAEIKKFIKNKKFISFTFILIWLTTIFIYIFKPELNLFKSNDSNQLKDIILQEEKIDSIYRKMDLFSSRVLEANKSEKYIKKINFKNNKLNFERRIHQTPFVFDLSDIFQEECNLYFMQFHDYIENHRLLAAIEKNYHQPIDFFGEICKRNDLPYLKNTIKNADVDLIDEIKSNQATISDDIWYYDVDETKTVSIDNTLLILKPGTLSINKDFLRTCIYYLLSSVNPDLYFVSGKKQLQEIASFFKKNNQNSFFIIYGETLREINFKVDFSSTNQQEISLTDHDFVLSGSRYCYLNFVPGRGVTIGEL
jgi:hypothetical protein